MMLGLVRRNPAVRNLPRWLVISAVTATSILNVVAFVALKTRSIDTGVGPEIFVSLLWAVLSIYLIFGEVSTRCGPLDMALPIPTRRLWLSHLIAVTLAGVAIMAVTTGLTAGGIWLLWKLMGKWLLQVEEIGGLAAHLSAGLILAIALLQRPDPPLQKLPRTLPRTGVSFLVLTAVLVLMLILQRYHPIFALLPLAVALAVGLLRYYQVPAAFTLVPAEAQAEDAGVREKIFETSPRTGTLTREDWVAATSVRSGSKAGFMWFVGTTVQRCSVLGLKKKQTPWVTIPFLIAFGAIMSSTEYWYSISLRYAYVLLAVYMLVAFTGMPLTKLGILDSLPIPRRWLFATLIFPSFVALAAGYALGWGAVGFAERARAQKQELIEFVPGEHEEKQYYYIHVPIRFCEVKWGGEPPVADSPWGETQKVWRTPLFKGSPVKVYLPTATGPGSSIEFAALQLSRATELVYGEAVPPEEIKERYLETRGDGTVGLKGEKLTIQADFPDLQPKKDPWVYPVILMMVGVLWMLVTVIYLRKFRAGVPGRERTWTMWGILVGLLVLWLGQFVVMMVGFMEPHVIGGFLDIVTRKVAESLPGGAVTMWILCALLFAGAYRLAEARFEKVEMPYEPQPGQ